MSRSNAEFRGVKSEERARGVVDLSIGTEESHSAAIRLVSSHSGRTAAPVALPLDHAAMKPCDLPTSRGAVDDDQRWSKRRSIVRSEHRDFHSNNGRRHRRLYQWRILEDVSLGSQKFVSAAAPHGV